jgi:SNF2 family DNA or RNA helicase
MTATIAPASAASCDLSPYHADRIAVWSDYRLKDSVKRVPGARWDGDNRCWTVPLTWPSCLALRAELGRSLTIGGGLNAWAKEQREAKEAVKALCGAHVLDELDVGDAECYVTMYPHQRTGARVIADTQAFALFDEMGAGKGRTTLAGLRLAKEDGEEVFPALIVAPKSMLITWARDEIPRYFPETTISVVAGTPTKVREALKPGFDVYVCSYDTARRYSRHAGYPTVTLTPDEAKDKELNAIPFKSVVADEAQRIKNPSAKQTRALWQLGRHADYRVALSGTPIQDTPEDLWSILHFISPDEYPGKTAFVDRFLRVSYNPWGGREIKGLNPLNEIEFRANAETRFRRVTKAMALTFLPPKVFETRWVELPPRMRKAYESMVDVLVAELEGGDKLVAQSVLERAGRLIQIANASGTVTDVEETDADGVTKIKHVFKMELPSPKIEAFLEDVAEGDFDDQQVVVFSDSRQLIDLLSAEMTRKKLPHVTVTGAVTGDDRQEAVDAFQRGDVQFILITRAGGEGLTLTAASVMVRLVRSWSYIVHTQSEDRVHRIGSEVHDSILYVDYITDDTVELSQLARLNSKRERATEVLRDDELLDMLKPKK